MPIVDVTTTPVTITLGNATYVSESVAAITYNASEYSHSTVFVTSAADDILFMNLNAPPLTTHYTPPSECADRWMLAGGQEVTTTRRVPTAQASTTSLAPPEGPPGAPTSTADAITSAIGPPVAAPPMTSMAALLPRDDFLIQNNTVLSLDMNGTATDPSYRNCQPFKLAPTYSPGVCPDGQTIAEVTAWQVNASTGYRTFWQASCCRSGMTFGPEFYEACVSTFSTPLQALALLVTSPYSGASLSTTYEYTTSVFDTAASTWSTVLISSATTLSTGLAVAGPIVVAWQIEDFKLFPSEYATSLANKVGVILDSGDISGESSGLSTGAKAGIGVGVAVGVLAITIAVVLLYLRRRRKVQATAVPEQTIPEIADQDHDHARKRWWTGGTWRSEADTQVDPQELDDRTVHIVPGPPVELDGAELEHQNKKTGHDENPQPDRSSVEA